MREPSLTTKQLSKLLGVSPEVLRSWRRRLFIRGRLICKGPAFIRMGRVIRYRQSAVEDWITQCTAAVFGDPVSNTTAERRRRTLADLAQMDRELLTLSRRERRFQKAMIQEAMTLDELAAMTLDELAAMTPAELVEEVWWSATKGKPWRWWQSAGRTEYPVLLVNDEIHALVRWATRHKKNYRGVALRPIEVLRPVQRLRRIRGLSTRGKTVIETLTRKLEHFKHRGVCLVQDGPDRHYRDKVILHECFHLWQHRKGLDRKRSAAKALIKHPATSRALPCLRKHGGYDVGDEALVVTEMAAYVYSGDYAAIGLGRREAERWLAEYFRQHGVRRPLLLRR